MNKHIRRDEMARRLRHRMVKKYLIFQDIMCWNVPSYRLFGCALRMFLPLFCRLREPVNEKILLLSYSAYLPCGRGKFQHNRRGRRPREPQASYIRLEDPCPRRPARKIKRVAFRNPFKCLSERGTSVCLYRRCEFFQLR